MERLTKLVDGEWMENHDHDTRQWKNGHRACMTKLAAYENIGTLEALSALVEAKEEGRPCLVKGGWKGRFLHWVDEWGGVVEREDGTMVYCLFSHLRFDNPQAALERMEEEA